MSPLPQKSLVLFLFAALLVALQVGASPVSFPDSSPAQQHNLAKDGPEPDHAEQSEVPAPPPATDDDDDDDEPTVADLVNQVPQILDQLQNYLNTAVQTYAPNATTLVPAAADGAAAGASNSSDANQQVPWINVFNGFLSITSNLAQQLLQPEETESASAGHAEVPLAPSNTIE